MMRPIWSPTCIGVAHQPSAQERIPRSAPHARELREALRSLSRHRAERVAREVGRVLEDRKLGAYERRSRMGSSLPETAPWD